MAAKLAICTVCLSTYPARARANTLNLVALIFWPLLIWRLIVDRGQPDRCPRCRATGVPLDTPHGHELAARARVQLPP